MGARYVVSRLCQVAKKKHTLPVPLAMANPFPLSPWLSVPLPRGPHTWGVGGGGRRKLPTPSPSPPRFPSPSPAAPTLGALGEGNGAGRLARYNITFRRGLAGYKSFSWTHENSRNVASRQGLAGYNIIFRRGLAGVFARRTGTAATHDAGSGAPNPSHATPVNRG